MIELVTVAAASCLAGFVDAVVGGGGLVLVPALFAAYPNAVPATLFGTNKGGAIWGTAWAAVQFARRVTLARLTMAWGMAGAMAGSFGGALQTRRVHAAKVFFHQRVHKQRGQHDGQRPAQLRGIDPGDRPRA